MLRLRTFLSVGAALVTAALLGSPGQARAAFTLHIVSGADNITVTDGGAGDVNPLTGAITFAGTAGNFLVSVNTAISNSGSGNPAVLSQVNGLVSTGAGTITITAADTNFSTPLPAAVTNVVSQLSNTQSTISGQTVVFRSALNGVPGTPITETATSGVVSATDVFFNGANPFTLSNVTTVTVNGAGVSVNTTGQTSVNAVPAPAGIVLALTALPALGAGGWLRRRSKAVAA